MSSEYMTVAEAAKILNRTKQCIAKLCLTGKIVGARKFGERVWMIPTQSVLEFKPIPQGRPRGTSNKEKKRQAELDEWNAAIKFFGSQKLAIA